VDNWLQFWRAKLRLGIKPLVYWCKYGTPRRKYQVQVTGAAPAPA